MDATPANRYNTVPHLVEASRRLGLPVVVPTDEDLVDRATVEQFESADPGAARASTAVTVVLTIGPPLHLITSRHAGSDGDARALQTALSGYAMNADPAAFRRDPGGHLESIIQQSATLEATPAVSDALIDGERWDGRTMQLGEHQAWSGHRDGVTVTLIGPAGSFHDRDLSWAGVAPVAH